MKSTALSLALFSLSFAAAAADVGQHPAVFSPRSLPAIDAATFIPGHPAGGRAGRAQAVDQQAVAQPSQQAARRTADDATTRVVAQDSAPLAAINRQ